jgi:purine-binding chemotaxis protein CheW
MTAHSPLHRRREDMVLRRCVSFELDGQRYALDILHVREVVAAALIEPVPGSPPEVLGVINLRGRIVTVLDLRRQLGLPPSEDRAPACVVVCEERGEPLALRVDRIAELCSIPQNAIRPAPPALGRCAGAVVAGVVSRDGGLLTLLDTGALLAPA